ncbi:MAG: hypothetical protein KA184_00265, partial [Candidatus Hydrogenedentes bacterium]|nr:hypothetical protein [Candidatus Hydrogenedentota bacterium]
KTVNWADGDRSMSEIIEIAKPGPVLVYAVDGAEFILEEADEFEREVAALGNSDKFLSFLQRRSQEGGEVPASDVAKRLGIDAEAL